MKKRTSLCFVMAISLLLAFCDVQEGFCKKADFDVDHWIAELQKRGQGQGSEKVSPIKAEAAHASPAQESGSDEGKKAQTTRISVDFYKIDLHNVFRLLGEISGKNIVVDESVKGTVTLSLKDVPWTFVLDVIKSLKGLSSLEKYNTIMVFPAGKKVAWGGGDVVEEGRGALEVKKVPEFVVPEVKANGLVVKGEQASRTPFEAIEKARQLIQEARARDASGDVLGALALYEKASDLWKDNGTIAKKVATLALGRANQELTAFNYARRALKASPSDSGAAALAAVALARMGRSNEALKYFERAAGSPDVTYEDLYNYAVFAFSNGLYREVIRIVNRLEEHFPITSDAMLLKARAFEAMNHPEKAISEYVAVINGGQGVPFEAKEYARSRLKEIAGTVGEKDKNKGD